ncbi:MAG: hypothetical protein KAV99_02760 [Candidatus Latescibacteria bacterium]|nr:hypothetical protein [Candidatus Latescibacterota bacterium]
MRSSSPQENHPPRLREILPPGARTDLETVEVDTACYIPPGVILPIPPGEEPRNINACPPTAHFLTTAGTVGRGVASLVALLLLVAKYRPKIEEKHEDNN